MHFVQKSFPGARIVGIWTRTSQETSLEDLGALWQRFGEEEVLAAMDGVVDPAIVMVYTGYSGANNEEYTAVLGCSVSETAPIPEGMIEVVVTAGTYGTLEVEGEFGEVIPETWAAINASDVLRAYTTDFEWYDMEEQDGQDPKATIYIAMQ